MKNLVLEKRKQNEPLREKANKALLYLTISNREKIVNKKLNFDIKDNKGKTSLDYALKHSDENILRLFLDAFYEIKEDRKREYHKLELKYQKRSKKFLDCANIFALISNLIVSGYITYYQSKSKTEETFTSISIVCSVISLILFLCNSAIDRQKEFVKRKIENYTEKIKIIEKIPGKSIKAKVEVYSLEEYNTILEQAAKHAEDISRLESMLNKLTHEARLESKNKFNISPQKMSRRGSTELAERRSPSFLGNLGEKLGQYARRTSRVQDIMDSESCSITIDKHSEKDSQSKLNFTVNSLVLEKKTVGFFKKKKESG